VAFLVCGLILGHPKNDAPPRLLRCGLIGKCFFDSEQKTAHFSMQFVSGEKKVFSLTLQILTNHTL